MVASQNSSRTRSWLLGAILLFAIFMGAGPGVYLVNPGATGVTTAGETATSATIAGIPILYLWYTFWFFVEAAVVVIAFFIIWRKEGAEE